MGLYPANDNRHSQLSKSHGPAQTRVDAETKGPPREGFGACRLMEVSSEKALTDFTMGGTVKGIAWSLNPYLGCLHACRYCYVPDTMHLERSRWGRYVAPKQNLPTILRDELKERPMRTVYLSTATDPYQAAERDQGITRACLQLLARHDWPVEILTRSPLVLRDLDVLKRFSRLRVGLSVPTLDEGARRLMEPNAPPIPARLDALRRLADAGLTVFANYSPAYPPTGDVTVPAIAEAFRAAGVQWVNTSYWRRGPSFLAPLWDEVHDSPWKGFAQFIADPKAQSALRKELGGAFKAVGIPLHTGFFNPIFDLTSAYEATSQMKLETEQVAAGGPTAPAIEVTVGAFRRRLPS